MKQSGTETNEHSTPGWEKQLEIFGARDACVAELLNHRYPEENIAFTFADASLRVTNVTHRSLRVRSERIAAALQARGVGVGDRVATLMGKTYDHVAVLLAIWRIGAVHVPLFTAFATPAIAYRLFGSGAKVVVCDATQRPKLLPGDDLPGDVPWQVIVASGERLDVGDQLLGDLEAENQLAPVSAAVGGDAPLLLIYTSGTTGTPKGVAVPVKALASFWTYMVYGLDLRPDDVFWNAADPGWAYGLYYGILGPLALGQTSILLDATFSADLTWEVLRRQRVTNFAAAPTVYRALRASSPARSERLALRCASSAGEPLTPDIIEWSQAVLGLPVHDHYGQTEGGMMVNNHQHPSLRQPLKSGCMGRAMPGWAPSVLELEADVVASPNGVGRMAIDMTQSPLAWFGGYHGSSPDVAAQTLKKFSSTKHWYFTGDTASVDEDGNFFFRARDDDVIIMAGYRIGPFEVESVLATHPAVMECAAIAVPDEIRGEVLEAHVVLVEGMSGDEELTAELQQLVKDKFSRHAYPRNVVYVDALPKTPSGKVQRFVLRAERRGQMESR
jgi:acetyl-CoA synthetase